MATTFQLKRSSVEGKQPNVADLQVGELAVNLADGILYSKNTAGNIIVVGSSTTSNVTEGVNLYFTNARAVSALTGGSGISIAANGLISSSVSVSANDYAGFINSTLYTFPTGDFGENESYVSDPNFETEDPFGVLLFLKYDCMEPIGRMVNEDLEALT